MSHPDSFARSLALAAACLAIGPLSARGADYETPPVLEAQQAAPPALLSGAGWRVAPQVPTDGITTRFTVQSDAGTFQVLGVETLAIREREIPAIVTLDNSSKAGTFLAAVGNTALKPIESAAQMLTNPGETLEGLPGGLDRFFGRVSLGAQELGAAATGGGTDVAASGESVAQLTAGITANALGYNAELRALAKQLGVDPYTSNAVLAKKLNEFARVAFAGHVATNTLISVAVPASLIITGTNVTRDLVYDTPAADLITRNQTRLSALGIGDDAIAAFQKAPGFTLTLQTEFVEALQPVAAGATGEADVVALAASAKTSDQALFLVRALRMLGRYQQEVAPLAALSARRTVSAVDTNGAVILPAPADYVSWTERVAGVAERDDLAAPQRSVWLTGRMTPRAKLAFETLGWTVRERVADRP